MSTDMWAGIEEIGDVVPVIAVPSVGALSCADFQGHLKRKQQLSTAARYSRVTPLKRRRVSIADADDIVAGNQSDADPQKARVDRVQARRQLARIEHVDVCLQSARKGRVESQRAIDEGLNELLEEALEARAIEEAHYEAECDAFFDAEPLMN